MNDVDHISLFDIKFTEGEEFEGKCIFQNQECFYSCVNYDFSYSDSGDEMGYRLFRLSHAESGKVLGHYTKTFSK